MTLNYNFSSENRFIVQISDVDDGFLNPLNLNITSSTASLLESEFPEGYLYGKEYLLRVLSTETGVYSRFMKILSNHNPVLDFETNTTSCLNDPYEITYTGSTEGESIWDFDGAQIISGSGFGPYKLKWLQPGEKVVRFSMDNGGCIKDEIFNITIAPPPAVPEICMVTVDEETFKNKIIWSNASDNVISYGIYRETNVANQYSLINIVESNNTSFIDTQSSPDQVSNRYKISVIDQCGFESEFSTLHKTIHLTINKGLGTSWNLIWNEYEGASFGTYQIFRSVDNGNMELLTEIASNLTSYTDLNPPSGILSYQIVVMNPDNCEGQENARSTGIISSKSNIAKNIITGIDDLEKNSSILVFPNPTSQKTLIVLKEFLDGEFYVKDLNGRLIKSGLLEKTFNIDFSDDPRGVYILTIKSKNGLNIKKIVKN